MTIKRRYLDSKEFQETVLYLTKRNEEKYEQHKEAIAGLIKSCDDGFDFLKKIDKIDDESIQRSCRMAALAQMFNARADYDYYSSYYSNSKDYISYCKNQIAVIAKPHAQGCVIVSKYGDILVDEGKLSLNGRGFYGPYVVVRKIENEEITWIEGVYSNAGEIVFPFGLFDEIHLSLSLNTAKYKSLELNFRIWGNLSNVDDDDLNFFKESIDHGKWYISPDNVVFSLSGYWENGNPDINEFEEKINPFILSKERVLNEQCRRMR